MFGTCSHERGPPRYSGTVSIIHLEEEEEEEKEGEEEEEKEEERGEEATVHMVAWCWGSITYRHSLAEDEVDHINVVSIHSPVQR